MNLKREKKTSGKKAIISLKKQDQRENFPLSASLLGFSLLFCFHLHSPKTCHNLVLLLSYIEAINVVGWCGVVEEKKRK